MSKDKTSMRVIVALITNEYIIGRLLANLFLAFVLLKLMGYITWSWWWVTMPLWATMSVLVVGVFGGSIIILCHDILSRFR